MDYLRYCSQSPLRSDGYTVYVAFQYFNAVKERFAAGERGWHFWQ